MGSADCAKLKCAYPDTPSANLKLGVMLAFRSLALSIFIYQIYKQLRLCLTEPSANARSNLSQI
jgi:hypothetical protein